MADLNKVLLLARLTRDVELRYAPSGSPIASFGLATNRKWTGQDGQKKEETTFVDISCFGKTAELCSQYLSKGRQVLIEGRLKYSSWEAQDGSKRNKLSVVAERVTFIGGREDNDQGGGYSRGGGRREDDGRFAPDDDDVPF